MTGGPPKITPSLTTSVYCTLFLMKLGQWPEMPCTLFPYYTPCTTTRTVAVDFGHAETIAVTKTMLIIFVFLLVVTAKEASMQGQLYVVLMIKSFSLLLFALALIVATKE